MSCVPVVGDGDAACANCGKQGSDTVKLKTCTDCRLVRYCGMDCQKIHRKLHKKACKERAAELKGEKLYSQGHERPEGDICPICTLPIPLPMSEHSSSNACCMNRICHGCNDAAQNRGMHDCPFCRTPYPNNDVEEMAMIQARVDKKDPEAINLLAQAHCHGLYGKLKDVRKAVELWEEAAELGSNDALYNLGSAYYIGEGVQVDEAKGGEFYKMAAMRGCAVSRYNLGAFECMKRNHANAYRHWLISAKMGYRNSFSSINIMLFEGKVTKGQHAEALKGYQDAIEEMKSHDRDEAKAKRRCD